MNPPPDHPQRILLADEVHARPSRPLSTPSRASYVATLIEHENRPRETAHLAQLCEQFGVVPPALDAVHFGADLGALALTWERHGEFSSYTFFKSGRSPTPFGEPPAAALPEHWLAGVPGTTICAVHGTLVPLADETPDAQFLIAHFGRNVVIGAETGEGAGLIFTDFRIHADGFSRILLLDRSFTRRQAGRTLQRLFEIEAYRMMALLALPVARRQSELMVSIERSLSALTDSIAREGGDDETLLKQLTRLAAEVESSLAASQFRFGACRAYHELVMTRITELRERRLPGLQPIEEFMARRFTPAAATCASTSQRLHQLSERVSRASALLSTRVDITRERQNQRLLESMNRRAQLQLRLQQTVEGLSVAAIVYYGAGLVGYLAKALKAAGIPVQPDVAIGVAIPLIAMLVIWVMRRIRLNISDAAEVQSDERQHVA